MDVSTTPLTKQGGSYKANGKKVYLLELPRMVLKLILDKLDQMARCIILLYSYICEGTWSP